MTDPAPSPTAYYTAAEVASALRCSAWWVKDQARRGRIPYCWVAASYRFTEEHMAEIQRLLERRPTVPVRPGTPAAPSATSGRTARRSPAPREVGASAGLRARAPRRLREAGTTNAFAA